jgi:hypothetical protein
MLTTSLSTRPPAASASRRKRRTPTIGVLLSVVAAEDGAAVWAVIRASFDGSSSARNAIARERARHRSCTLRRP